MMICLDCVTPEALKRLVNEHGRANTCHYCGTTNTAVTASLVFNYIFERVKENFAGEDDLSQFEHGILYEGGADDIPLGEIEVVLSEWLGLGDDDVLPREVAAVVSISGRAVGPGHIKTVEFSAVKPNRAIIRTEAHLLHFRQQFNAFLIKLTQAGVRVLHLHSATPLSASVEIGRTLLPKIFEEVHAWEWKAPAWQPAVRLK
ncbi:hypothetical protein [Paraburkholderia fungorum]|uniref:hypothetical protein n=1 Tax=Paraburkholderia fungorum TaxID=134537 RepID=UPI0038BB21AA